MINKEEIIKHVDNLIVQSVEAKGHFDENVIDLGNGRYGVDVFTFIIKGKKDEKQLYLQGIYKDGTLKLLESIGIFCKKIFNTDCLIYKEQNIISQISIKEIKDKLNQYFEQLTSLRVEINGVTNEFSPEAQIETFYKQSNIVINEGFLDFLRNDESEILSDEADKSYLCFLNEVIEVSKNQIKRIKYQELKKVVVWRDKIIHFDLGTKSNEKYNFEVFIRNISSNDPNRFEAVRCAIGYLLHNFHKASGGQMVILYDEQITDIDNPQGGTGKGIVAKAIKQLRKTVKIDGKKIKGDNNFDFQDLSYDTELLWIDDVGKQLDIDRFNSISTDGFNIEKKFKDSILIPAEKSPKILICSNIILDCTGTTRKRRQFIIELSSHYSSMIINGDETPIVSVHGAPFFSPKWDAKEWNGFYWFMIDSLQFYLKNGLKAIPSINVFENRSKQIIGEDLHNWIVSKSFENDVDYQTKKFYDEFKMLFEEGNQTFTQRSFTNKLKKFYSIKNQKITFESKSVKSEKLSFFRISN